MRVSLGIAYRAAAVNAMCLCWAGLVSAQAPGTEPAPAAQAPAPAAAPAPAVPATAAAPAPAAAPASSAPAAPASAQPTDTVSSPGETAPATPDQCSEASPKCGMVFALEQEFPNLTERKRLYAECRASWGCPDAMEASAGLEPLRHRALARLRAFGGWQAARFRDAFNPASPPRATFDNNQAGTATKTVHSPVIQKCAAHLPELWGSAARKIRSCIKPVFEAATKARGGRPVDGNGFKRPLSPYFAEPLEENDAFHECVERALGSGCVADLWGNPSYALVMVTAPVNREVMVQASGDLGFSRVMHPDEAFVAPRDIEAHFLVMAPAQSVLTLSEGAYVPPGPEDASRRGAPPMGEPAVERRLLTERYDAIALGSVVGGGYSSKWRCLDLTVTGEKDTAVYVDGYPVALQPANLSDEASTRVEGRALYRMQGRKNRRAIRLNVINARPGVPEPVLYSQTLDFDNLSSAIAKDGCAPLEVDVTNLERVILLPVKASPHCSDAGVDPGVFYQRMSEYLRQIYGDKFVDIQSWSRTLAQVEKLAPTQGPAQSEGPMAGMTTQNAPAGADRGRVSTTGIMGAYGAEQFRQGFKYIYSADLACNPRSEANGGGWDFTVIAHRTNVEAASNKDATGSTDGEGPEAPQRSHSLTVSHQLEVLDLVRVPLAALSGTGFSRFRNVPKEVWDFEPTTIRLDSDSPKKQPQAAQAAKAGAAKAGADDEPPAIEHEFGWWGADALFPGAPNAEAEMEHMCRDIDGRAVGREESWADRIQGLQKEGRQQGGWRSSTGYHADMEPTTPGIHVIGTRTWGIDNSDNASFRCVRVLRPEPRFMLEASLGTRASAPGDDAHLGSATSIAGQAGYWHRIDPESPFQVGSALGYGITFHDYDAPTSWDDFGTGAVGEAVGLQGRLEYSFTRHSVNLVPALIEWRPLQFGRTTPWLRLTPLIVDLGFVDASDLPAGLSNFAGGDDASDLQFDFDVGAMLALGMQIRLDEGNAISPFIGLALTAWDDLASRSDRNTVLDDGGLGLRGGVTWSL